MKDVTFFLIIAVIITSFSFTGGSYADALFQTLVAPTTQTGGYTLSTQQPTPATHTNLQMRTPVFITGTPRLTPIQTTTTAPCGVDTGIPCAGTCEDYSLTCVQSLCTNIVSGPNVCPDDGSGRDIISCIGLKPRMTCNYVNNVVLHLDPHTGKDSVGLCNKDDYAPGGNGTFCVGKPVIYLYPSVDTVVDVSLSVPGDIIASIPQYPKDGWQNVLAHPNGSLEYQGKTYTELFYESQIAHVLPPQQGIIIPKSQLPTQLPTLLFHLGLNTAETDEFMDFWLPKLKALKGNYVQFSLFDQAYKEQLDGVHISPAPDTRIELLAYFKPLATPIAIEPLILPENPPKRVGFTQVEWGATIDNSGIFF